MRLEDLDILRCPDCGGRLEVFIGEVSKGALPEGLIRCLSCSAEFPVIRSIPRFSAPKEETSYDIGFARYQGIQLDSVNGSGVAGRRIDQLLPLASSGLSPRLLLEVGCGSGRYTEHLLKRAVDVWAVDLSASALEACRQNLKHHPKLHLVQGDIERLPFGADLFDVVCALGILMALPSPSAAIRSLRRHLKPAGRMVVDIYRWRPRHWLNPRTWLRPIMSRLPAPLLWKGCELLVPILWPLSRALGRIPKAGGNLRSLVPISNYDGVLPLDEDAQRQFSILDTFDALAARYSHCVTEGRLRHWLTAAGFSEIEIFPGGMMAAAARNAARRPGHGADGGRHNFGADAMDDTRFSLGA